MAQLREIYQLGSDVIRSIASEVEDVHSVEIQALIEDMIFTCKNAKGVGIAAPQVNCSKAIGVNFRNILKRSSVKERVLYNLRHTFASQLISNGADIVYVSKTLGHKDVSITLKIYTKFIKEEDAVRLEKMKKIDKFMVKFPDECV